jgi:hypothetical protein
VETLEHLRLFLLCHVWSVPDCDRSWPDFGLIFARPEAVRLNPLPRGLRTPSYKPLGRDVQARARRSQERQRQRARRSYQRIRILSAYHARTTRVIRERGIPGKAHTVPSCDGSA